MTVDDRALRTHLTELLSGAGAHADYAESLENLPFKLQGAKPAGAPHTPWQLLEHMRISIHDLLDFSTNSNYLAPNWPADYWPSSDAPASESDWEHSVRAFRADLKEFEKLIHDDESNLYAPIPWGDGQTIFREVLLAADHNSYHLGQLILLRQQLGAWKS
jgi:uncharacterized damage-inducible protein DinB